MKPSPATASWQSYRTSFETDTVDPYFGDKITPAFDAAPNLVFLGWTTEYSWFCPTVTIRYRSQLPMDEAQAAAMDVVTNAYGRTFVGVVSDIVATAGAVGDAIVGPLVPGLALFDQGAGDTAGGFAQKIQDSLADMTTTVRVVAIAAAVLGAVYLVTMLKPRAA